MHIPAVCLSVIGGIQPGKLKNYILGAMKENGSADDGLLQRFQMIVWPDSMGEWVNKEVKPDKEARDKVYRLYEDLDSLTVDKMGAELDIDDEIPYLKFSPEAQEVFNDWRNRLENRLRSEEMESSPAWESHLAKYRSLMPSLALIFHLVIVAHTGNPGSVSEYATRLAADWCEYLEHHAKKIYSVEKQPGIRQAMALLEKIKEGKIVNGENIGKIQEKRWSKLGEPSEVRIGLETLEYYRWIKVFNESTGGRPSERILINPHIKNIGTH